MVWFLTTRVGWFFGNSTGGSMTWFIINCHSLCDCGRFHNLQAPFNSSHFTAVMSSVEAGKKVYRCGQNWFRHNLSWTPTSGVTCMHSVVWKMMRHMWNPIPCYLKVGQFQSKTFLRHQSANVWWTWSSRTTSISPVPTPLCSKFMCPKRLGLQIKLGPTGSISYHYTGSPRCRSLGI